MSADSNLVLDNSARSTFRSCEKKYNFQNNLGLQPNVGSTALRFGSCWHAMQEAYYLYVIKNGWPKSPDERMIAFTGALQAGQAEYEKESEGKSFYDDYKNFNTAAEGFDKYLEYFANDPEFVEILSTEQAFSCPIEPENKTEEKLLAKIPPLIFTGRIDLCLRMDGVNWINDFKTTGWILDKVISQANRSPQFIGYTYAGKKVLDFDTVGCLGNFLQIGATKSRTTGNYGKKIVSPLGVFRRYTPKKKSLRGSFRSLRQQLTFILQTRKEFTQKVLITVTSTERARILNFVSSMYLTRN